MGCIGSILLIWYVWPERCCDVLQVRPASVELTEACASNGTDEGLREFGRKGFVSLPGFVAESDLEHFRHVWAYSGCDIVAASTPQGRCPFKKPQTQGFDLWYRTPETVNGIRHLVRRIQELTDLRLVPEDMLGQLAPVGTYFSTLEEPILKAGYEDKWHFHQDFAQHWKGQDNYNALQFIIVLDDAESPEDEIPLDFLSFDMVEKECPELHRLAFGGGDIQFLPPPNSTIKRLGLDGAGANWRWVSNKTTDATALLVRDELESRACSPRLRAGDMLVLRSDVMLRWRRTSGKGRVLLSALVAQRGYHGVDFWKMLYGGARKYHFNLLDEGTMISAALGMDAQVVAPTYVYYAVDLNMAQFLRAMLYNAVLAVGSALRIALLPLHIALYEEPGEDNVKRVVLRDVEAIVNYGLEYFWHNRDMTLNGIFKFGERFWGRPILGCCATDISVSNGYVYTVNYHKEVARAPVTGGPWVTILPCCVTDIWAADDMVYGVMEDGSIKRGHHEGGEWYPFLDCCYREVAIEKYTYFAVMTNDTLVGGSVAAPASPPVWLQDEVLHVTVDRGNGTVYLSKVLGVFKGRPQDTPSIGFRMILPCCPMKIAAGNGDVYSSVLNVMSGNNRVRPTHWVALYRCDHCHIDADEDHVYVVGGSGRVYALSHWPLVPSLLFVASCIALLSYLVAWACRSCARKENCRL